MLASSVVKIFDIKANSLLCKLYFPQAIKAWMPELLLEAIFP